VRAFICFILITWSGVVLSEAIVDEQAAAAGLLVNPLDSAQAEDGAAVTSYKNVIQKKANVKSDTSVEALSNWPIVILALFGMIVLIFSLAWFARRFGGFNMSGNRDLRVVSSIVVGTRERVALIDVKGQQFLLGVTGQNISHLHTFEQAVITSPVSSNTQTTDFSEKLQGLLKKIDRSSDKKMEDLDK
jgi:flagellar biosynthetic protein FliO